MLFHEVSPYGAQMQNLLSTSDMFSVIRLLMDSENKVVFFNGLRPELNGFEAKLIDEHIIRAESIRLLSLSNF